MVPFSPGPVSVAAEQARNDPFLWAYALYHGRPRALLVRSQAKYGTEQAAILAGDLEVANVTRNLRRLRPDP